MKPANLRAIVEAQEDRATWRQGDFDRDAVFVRDEPEHSDWRLSDRVIAKANANFAHVGNIAAVVALHNHAEAAIALAEATARLATAWRDTSGSATSADAITDACHGVVAAHARLEAIP